MTIASEVKSKIQSASAFTLEGGYAVFQEIGHRVLFPAARMSDTKRNAKGRCTAATALYADGSRLRFTYSENRGAALKEI